MPHLINQNNIFDAWKEAVTFLLKNGRQSSNIILAVEEPDIFDESWIKKHDPKKIKKH
jgi:hypothetical protein